MNTLGSPVERNLRRVEQRWKWLRFLEYSATLAAIVTLAVLLLGGMKTLGWFSSVTALAVFIILVLIAGFFAWFIGGFVVAVSEKERRWLAAAIEQAHAPLQDRLNTLVHLEQGKQTPETQAYANRIERQARVVLARQKTPSAFLPLRPLRPLARLFVSAMLLLVTIWFYNRFHPLRAVAAEAAPPVAAAEPEPVIDIPPPETEIYEQESVWGEVRIIDPGRDVVVTRVETIPLQIEVATSDALKSVEWITAVNGADEQPHMLPAPTEPRYAAYAPAISVAEFPLSDWDVLTYYAQATTDKGETYRSEVYFVEVQPFREELETTAGGQSGQCSKLLNELTGMIERQQELIRQTYRSQAAAGNNGDAGQEARGQIAEAELELAQATNHVGAKMAAEFDQAAIAEPLSRLEQAESNMRSATGSLRDNAVDQSIRDERSALAALASARKQLQESISSDPDAFSPKASDAAQLPELAAALKRTAEFRDEEKAARDFMNKAIAQQRNIARQAATGKPQPKPPLAEQELGLQQSLEEFQQQHPQMFRGTEEECAEALQTLRQTAEAIRQGDPSMHTLPGQATEQLESLQQAMQQATEQQQLSDAYRLKSVLDDLIDQFTQLEREPDSMTQEQMEQAASQAQEVAKQLQELAENQPTREQFDEQLREAVNEDRQQQLQSHCNALCRSQNAGDKSGAAAGVKSQLQQMAGAFERSAPQSLAKSTPPAQPGNSPRPGAQESLDRGLRQLEGLMKNSQQGRPLSPTDEARQRGEALHNVQDGVRGLFGDNQRSQAMLSELEEELQDATVPVDVAMIERLVRELEKRRIEAGAAGVKNPAAQPVTLIDPARLPPAYRRQIEKYFEKLSEQR